MRMRRVVVVALALPMLGGNVAMARPAATAWSVQMRVVAAQGFNTIVADAHAGAYCWASVQYSTGIVRAVTLLAQTAGATGLLAWTWVQQPGAGVASVGCAWQQQTRTASASFGDRTMVTVPSSGLPAVQAPTGTKILGRWTSADPNMKGVPGLGPAFTAKGTFDVIAAFAPQTPGQPARALAIGAQTQAAPGGRAEWTGVIEIATLASEQWRFSQVDCSQTCTLGIDGATGLNWTILVTQ